MSKRQSAAARAVDYFEHAPLPVAEEIFGIVKMTMQRRRPQGGKPKVHRAKRGVQGKRRSPLPPTGGDTGASVQ